MSGWQIVALLALVIAGIDVLYIQWLLNRVDRLERRR